jgi:hypothetical protein
MDPLTALTVERTSNQKTGKKAGKLVVCWFVLVKKSHFPAFKP